MNITKFFLASFLTLALITPVYANKDMSADEKVQKIQRELNLTDSQANQIRPIIEDYKNKMDNARQEKERRLSQILTNEQMDKIRSMKDK